MDEARLGTPAKLTSARLLVPGDQTSLASRRFMITQRHALHGLAVSSSALFRNDCIA
jgi:hypothetical protein